MKAPYPRCRECGYRLYIFTPIYKIGREEGKAICPNCHKDYTVSIATATIPLKEKEDG